MVVSLELTEVCVVRVSERQLKRLSISMAALKGSHEPRKERDPNPSLSLSIDIVINFRVKFVLVRPAHAD